MIVDRAAQAMTEGAPRPGFTARVMSTILGRPRPGFTSRVMEALDAPERRMPASGLRPALAAVGAIAAAVAAVSWLPANPRLPVAPDAPRLAAWPYARAAIGVPPLPYDRWAPVTRSPGHAPIVTILRPDDSEAYPIAELPPAPPITVRSIDPPAPSIVPLSTPAALTIPALRFDKETP